MSYWKLVNSAAFTPAAVFSTKYCGFLEFAFSYFCFGGGEALPAIALGGNDLHQTPHTPPAYHKNEQYQ